MIEDKKEVKNGLDLLLHCYLTVESMESYNLRGLCKNYGNMFRNSIEKAVLNGIDKEVRQDEEFMNNALKIKKRMVKQIAELNEVDQILLSEFVNKFVNNIDIARKKGIVFFDKLLV